MLQSYIYIQEKNDFYNNCSLCYKTPRRLLCVPCGASSVLTAAAVCCVSYFTKSTFKKYERDTYYVMWCNSSGDLPPFPVLFHDKVFNQVRVRWKHLSLLVLLLCRHVMMRKLLLWFLSLCLQSTSCMHTW